MIDNIIQKFRNMLSKREDILTEDDLRCRLFRFLEEENNRLSGFENYEWHSEIRRYGDKIKDGERKLKYRSDLVLINKYDLHDNNGVGGLSKGYGFSDYKAIIELKLRRSNGESNEKFLEKIKKDIEKLQEIDQKTYGESNREFYVIIFDKRENIDQKIQENIKSDKIKLGKVKYFYKYF